MRMVRGWLVSVSLLAALTLGGCGGGGGGSGGAGGPGGTGSLDYQGPQTPLTLDSASTPAVAAAVLDQLGVSNDSSTLGRGRDAADAGGQSGWVRRGLEKAGGVLRERKPWARSGRQRIDESDSCYNSGSVRLTGNVANDGTGWIKFSYNDCNDYGLTLSGSEAYEIRGYDSVLEVITDLRLILADLRVSGGGSSFTQNGTVEVLTDAADGSWTSTSNMHSLLTPPPVYSRTSDFQVTWAATYTGLVDYYQTVQGRLYDSAHGYVDVQTLAPLGFEVGVDRPVEGQLLLTGAAGGQVLISFEQEQAVIELDADGDGSYEAMLSTDWTDLEETTDRPPVARAVAESTVARGALVTVDGSASGDWEGATLSYSWNLAERPEGSAAVLTPDGDSASFVADGYGRYEVELVVNDGTQDSVADRVAIEVPNPAVSLSSYAVARSVLDSAPVPGASITASAETDEPWSLATEIDYGSGAGGWLSVSPEDGAVSGAEDLALGFAAMPPGSYTASLTISFTTANVEQRLTVPVTYTVRAALGLSTLAPVTVAVDTTAAETLRSLTVNPAPEALGESFTAAVDVPWLSVTPGGILGTTGTLQLSLVPAGLADVANGTHTATVTVQADGFHAVSTPLQLNLNLPELGGIAPYVLAPDTAATVTLRGEGLMELAGRLSVGGSPASGLSVLDDGEATLAVPALSAGEYSLSLDNALAIPRSLGRLVVKAAGSFPTGAVPLPGRVLSLAFDAERDAIYGVFMTDYYGPRFARRLRVEGGVWQVEVIDAPNPTAVAVTRDGGELLVMSGDCQMHHVDPDTLALIDSSDPLYDGCSDLGYEMIFPLDDGEILLGHEGGSLSRYPGFEPVAGPYLHSAVGVLSGYGNRLIWANTPTVTPPNDIYYFDSKTDAFLPFMVQGSDTYFTASTLAISGDGGRVLYRNQVFNQSLDYLGALTVGSSSLPAPAITADGARGLLYDDTVDAVKVYDLTPVVAPFPQLGADLAIPEGTFTGVDRMLVSADGGAVFLFGLHYEGGSYPEDASFGMYVLQLP